MDGSACRDAISGSAARAGDVPACVRDASVIRATFAGTADRTRIDRLYRTGSFHLRFPRAGNGCEAVLINTGGGIAGGDRLSVDVQAASGAHVAMTSQAAEKVYRAEGAAAAIALRIRLAPESRLAWLPQETILFDGARLRRHLDADVAADAALTILEITILGRAACGERLETGDFRDRWRLRRDGRLILAEDVQLEGPIAATLARPAFAGGAAAMATLISLSPVAESRLDAVRAALAGASCEHGASAWNGMLVCRMLGHDAGAVRVAAARAAMALTDGPMPRSWSC